MYIALPSQCSWPSIARCQSGYEAVRLRKTCLASGLSQSQHRLQNFTLSLVCMQCMPLQFHLVWTYENVEEKESVTAQGSGPTCMGMMEPPSTCTATLPSGTSSSRVSPLSDASTVGCPVRLYQVPDGKYASTLSSPCIEACVLKIS